MKQSGNAKITFNDDDYFKIMKRLAEQQAALPGSMNVLGLGGPLYEDTRIVEGQGDDRDNMAEGTLAYDLLLVSSYLRLATEPFTISRFLSCMRIHIHVQ